MTIKKVGPYGQAFLDMIDKVEADAKSIDLNFTSVCDKSGASRASPIRWRRKLPLTIRTLDKMHAVIEKEKARLSKAVA